MFRPFVGGLATQTVLSPRGISRSLKTLFWERVQTESAFQAFTRGASYG